MPKNAEKFICKECDFVCYKQSNYNKHLLTSKHKNRTILNDLQQKMPENAGKKFQCDCGKKYSARNSLWYHKQKCQIINKEVTEEYKTINVGETTDQQLGGSSAKNYPPTAYAVGCD